MKRIVLIFIIILVSFGTYAQTYTITANGYIGSGPSSCGSNNNGLKWIKLYFSDGSIVDLFRQDGGQFRNRPYTFSKDFNVSKRLVGVRFRTVSRRNSLTGCRSSRVAEKTVNVNSPCFYRNYNNTEVYRDDINGWVAISIVPNINLTFNDGTPVSSIYSGCEDGSIGITATSGFTPNNDVYTWEFLDNVNTQTQNHPDYQVLINAEANAQGSYRACVRQSGDPDRCEFEFMRWMAAQQELNSYTGPRTIQVPVWRPIPNKTGQSNIALKLSDLYSSTTDQKSAVNKNIDVRLSPSCNVYNARTNQVTIQYLPAAPSISRTPEILPLACSYSSTAGFTMFFDRQIYGYEAIDINLLRKLDNSNTYVPYDNNTEIRSFGTVNSSTFSYAWRPSAGKEIIKGSYKIQVSGYSRGGDRTAPFCELYEYSFDVSAPASVNFTATSSGDQTCFGTNDGKIKITVTSGGAGDYEYSFDNWSSKTTFRGPEVEVTDLLPGPMIYNIQVRKKTNQCLAKDANGNPIIRTVVIPAATQITHQLGAVTHPGSSGGNNGKIVIQSVSGGTPFTGSNGDYYNATVLINGSTTNTVAYIAYANGFDVSGLPAGNHKIRYTDSSLGCTVEMDLPVLNDPLPISFSVQKQDPSCSDSNDGRFTILNLNGGYPPYTITWKKNNNNYGVGTSITGNQGNYEVAVTDSRSGEAKQTNIRFDNVPLPIIITNIDIQPILCNGDQARATITANGGGSGSYQYAVWTGATTSVWQDSNVFALDANTITGYRFRVRDRNTATCLSDISNRHQISQPTEIIVTPINVVHNNIFGDNQGTIEISVTGGKPNYNITWERNGVPISNTGTSISNLVAGRYVAVVRDANNCLVRSVVIEITEPNELLVSIEETIAIPCYNGIGTLSALVSGGFTSYTYQWFKDGAPINGKVSSSLSDIKAGNYRVRVEDGYTFADTFIKFEDPEALILPLPTIEHVSCFSGNDGKIALTPQGGTRPYYFSIDNKQTYISENALTNFTIEGLVAGSYEVWLKDANGCEIATPQTVTLTSPNEIIVTAKSIVHTTTLGGTNGSITMDDVIGGVGIYTYSWSKQGDVGFTRATRDIDNLSFGMYTISVQDTNVCVVEKTFEVKQPLPMLVDIEVKNPILCHDGALGELLATVKGGYPIESTPADFEYRWYKVESSGDVAINTDITLDRLERLKAGTYKVVTSDSQGATAEVTIDLTQPEDLVVKLSSASTEILCYGDTTGAIDITVEGGPKDPDTGAYLPYTYRWTKVEDPDFEATTEDLQNMPAGTYEVVVIDDNLCAASLNEAVRIKQPEAALEIYDVVAVDLTGFKAGDGSISLEVKGGTTPYSYIWINLDDPLYIASSQDINALQIGRYELVVTDANACSVSITREIKEPNQLIVAIVPLSDDEGVQCYGEATVVPLSATTQGGIGDYTYQWYEQKDPTTIIFTTPQTTVVGAGVYTVVVTDANGNTHSDTYTVEEPEALDLEQDVTHLLCRGDANGSIDITVKGGVQPYSYRWSTGESSEDLSSLRAGNYVVTVTDANNCTLTKTIEINQPPRLFVNGDIVRVNPSSSGARDGSITVNMIGGIPPYRYEWRDFGNVLQSSTTNVLDNVGLEKYSLTVTDTNGCSLYIPDVDVYDPPALKVEVQQVNVIFCNGNATGSLSAIADGGTPFSGVKQYTYQWFDADQNSVIGSDNFLLESIISGNYYVIVTDAKGTTITSADFLLTEPEELRLELDTDFVNCGDGEDWTIVAQIDGGTGPFSYLWSTGDTSDRIENVVGGTYSVEVTDEQGCYVTGQVITIAPEALVVNHSQTIPTCYEGCDGIVLLEILGGTAPYSYQWSNGQTGKNLTNICAGTYSVSITDAKGCQVTREYILDNPAALLVDVGEDITLCKNQSIVLDATITDPDATYFWTSENGYSSTDAIIEVSKSSIYQVVVTDSKGCVGSDSIFVDSSTEDITANFFASTQVFVGEKFVIVDNSDPIPDNVDWRFPEEAVVTYEDDNYAEAIFETPGEYEITLQTYRGLCTATTTKTIIVVEKEIGNENEEEGNADIQSFIDYLVYPNPTTDGRFKVEVALQKIQPISVKIFNMINNNLIDSKSGEGNETYIFGYDMSILPSGIYFVLLETSSASQVRKLIIE